MQDTSASMPSGARGRVGVALSHVRARPAVVSLAAVLLVALLARSYIYGSVFRDDAVVLLANDPYYYRFAVERHVASAGGDVGSLLRYDERDPFLVVALALCVALLGGVERAPVVLAWYPVVVGVATVALVYVLARLVSSSRLVGVVAAVALALTPAHVVRTALGFSDHHAADFLWLVVGATLLLLLWRTASSRRRFGLAAVLAVVLAVQVSSWEAGVMLVLPAALAVVFGSALDITAGRHPRAGLVAAGSFVVAALLVAAVSALLGWQSAGVVLALSLLAVCVALSVGALAALAAVDGVGRSTRLSLGVGAVPVVVGLVVAVAAVDERFAPVRSLFAAGAAFLDGTRGTGIAETVSLVGGPLGPLTGPLSLFGLLLFVALPSLVATSVGALRRRHVESAVVVTYAWYFLASALVQRRFAGELSPFVAVFVGVALVALARRAGVLPTSGTVATADTDTDADADTDTDADADALAAVSRAARRYGPTAFSVLVALLVVTSSGVLAVKLNQSVVTDAEYDAATAIRTYAVDHDLSHPESYVLSPFGTNRLLNYEVNADSVPELSYRYAEAHYATFAHSDSPERQYWRHHDRVGFVVTTADGGAASPASTWVRLHQRLGSRGGGVEGTGHYRLVYASADGSVRAFALVPGAVVVGQADPGARVSLSLPVTVGEQSFVYARETTTTDVGWYAITVPYPGTYVVDGRAVTVSERDVLDGRFVPSAGRSSANAHWSFDAGRGDVAFDPVGGFHGRVLGPAWTDDGLSFGGTGRVVVPAGPTPTTETGLALTVRFAGVEDLDRESPEPARFQRLVSTAPASRYTTTAGYQIGLVDGRIVGAIGDGDGAADVRGPAVDDGAAHTVSLLWDGRTVRLVVDGVVVDEAPYAGEVTPTETLVVGGTTDDRYPFRGVVTDVRLDLFRASTPPEGHDP